MCFYCGGEKQVKHFPRVDGPRAIGDKYIMIPCFICAWNAGQKLPDLSQVIRETQKDVANDHQPSPP